MTFNFGLPNNFDSFTLMNKTAMIQGKKEWMKQSFTACSQSIKSTEVSTYAQLAQTQMFLVQLHSFVYS